MRGGLRIPGIDKACTQIHPLTLRWTWREREWADGFLGSMGVSSSTLPHGHRTCPGLLGVMDDLLAEYTKQLYSAGAKTNMLLAWLRQNLSCSQLPALHDV